MGALLKTAVSQVKYFYQHTRLIIIAGALVIMSLPLSSHWVYILSGILVGTVGLMHGATDHVLFMNSRGLSTSHKIPRRFFTQYLGILAIYAVLWFAILAFAFAIFILVSCYHFGQTQLQYLKLSEKHFLKKLAYALWGFGVLVMIVFLNAEESEALIYSVFPNSWVTSLFGQYTFSIALSAAGLCAFMILITARFSRVKQVLIELLEIGVIFTISYFANLALSFALFFGLWHSLRACQVQIDKLRKNEMFKVRDFLKHSLPFTFISLIGIALLILASQYLESQILPEMLFLIAISVLTMPHMVIYEQFYNYHDS